MLGTAARLRTTVTIWHKSLWRYRLTSAGVVLTVFGAATAMSNPPRPASITTAFVGCVLSAMDILANHRRARMVRFQPRDGDTYRDVVEEALDLGTTVESARDIGVTMARESVQLRSRPIRASVSTTDYVLPRELRTWSFDFIAQRARTAAVYKRPGTRARIRPS